MGPASNGWLKLRGTYVEETVEPEADPEAGRKNFLPKIGGICNFKTNFWALKQKPPRKKRQ